jgi:hypothetical protein
MKLEGSLPRSQEPAACPRPASGKSSPQTRILFHSDLFLMLFHLHLGFSSGFFTSGVCAYILCGFLFFPMLSAAASCICGGLFYPQPDDISSGRRSLGLNNCVEEPTSTLFGFMFDWESNQMHMGLYVCFIPLYFCYNVSVGICTHPQEHKLQNTATGCPSQYLLQWTNIP